MLADWDWLGDCVFCWDYIGKEEEMFDVSAVLMPLTSPDGKIYTNNYFNNSDRCYMINADIDEEKYERIHMIIDYLVSEEGHALGCFGIGLDAEKYEILSPDLFYGWS